MASSSLFSGPLLAQALKAAETLASGMDFVRVDFYEVGGIPYFGEFCLYPGSGLDPFAADWIDFEMGSLWLNAKNKTKSKNITDFAKTKSRLIE